MSPEYYREYYNNERQHWWFRARECILRDQVSMLIRKGKLPPHPSILNIGAATGRSTEWLQTIGPTTSLEYDHACCEHTRAAAGLEIIEGSITALPFEADAYDLVCAFDVIEHVEGHALGVNEMMRVCKPGGIIFVSVPAFPFLWSEHDEINYHQRRYRMRELKSLFLGSGNIYNASYFNFWLFPFVAGIRLVRKLGRKPKPSELRSDFAKDKKNKFSGLLRRIFASERAFLNRRINFPFGVSAFLQWRK